MENISSDYASFVYEEELHPLPLFDVGWRGKRNHSHSPSQFVAWFMDVCMLSCKLNSSTPLLDPFVYLFVFLLLGWIKDLKSSLHVFPSSLAHYSRRTKAGTMSGLHCLCLFHDHGWDGDGERRTGGMERLLFFSHTPAGFVMENTYQGIL